MFCFCLGRCQNTLGHHGNMVLLSSCLSSPGGTSLLPVKSLTKLKMKVLTNSLSFNLNKTELVVKKESAGTCIYWRKRDLMSWWAFACLFTKCWQYRNVSYPMWIVSEVWWDRHCLTNFWSGVFPPAGCILGADRETTRKYSNWDVPSWNKALPRAVSTLAQLNSTVVWSAVAKWFEIYLLHFFFLPKTEEVNRHLKRDSPGLIVQQFLARHFQWKTLDSEFLFQGSPEWVHWPVGYRQAFTWSRNG